MSVQTKGMLFDMDGTLLVNAVWEYFAKQYSLDLSEVLKTSHGVRTVDNMKRWCGMTDEVELKEATELFETMIVTEAKRLRDEGKPGLQILPGVQRFLETLQKSSWASWAIVTSATSIYASAALPTAGIPPPPHLITADNVVQGKPHPEPYLTGAKRLGLDIKDCIVVEDAPSGVKAGVASGARVLAVCTSHTKEQLEGLGATWIVEDLSEVTASLSSDTIILDLAHTA